MNNAVPDQKLIDALNLNTAAALAAALITVSKRSHSVSEAVALARTVQYWLNPMPERSIHARLQEEAERVHT